MQEQNLTFIKKVVKSSAGFLIWIPKDIATFLNLNSKNTFQINLSKLEDNSDPIIFTKKISKSGKGFLIWIPKDISNFINLKKETLCQITMQKLGDQK